MQGLWTTHRGIDSRQLLCSHSQLNPQSPRSSFSPTPSNTAEVLRRTRYFKGFGSEKRSFQNTQGDGDSRGMKYIYIYIQLIHTVVQKKLTQHCKAIIRPLKIKYKEHAGKEIICVTQKENVRKVFRGWEEMQISGQKADELWKRTGCMRVPITFALSPGALTPIWGKETEKEDWGWLRALECASENSIGSIISCINMCISHQSSYFRE